MFTSLEVMAELQKDMHLATAKDGMDMESRDIHAHSMLVEAEEGELTKDNSKKPDGKTPLHFAAEYGNMTEAQQLLDKRANPKAEDKSGKTPLHWAAEEGHVNVTKLLRRFGANLEAKDKRKNT